MVNLEAARAICDMTDISAKELHPAIAVLQLFLSSPKATLRFAAIRTLNKLSINNPSVVAPCNLDIENLITDSNRSIATFAITTLLKTGNEASVDRLMKQISGFMNDISDEFKVIVVEAIRSLCLKFPAKQAVMLSFLSNVLRDEGGYNFKKAVVEAIFDMVKYIPESKDTALSHLCEFIEDCEFTKLSVRVLHLLGIEGPKTATPTKYIRYIYNRVILENSIVRAAAVSALAKFGVNSHDEEVRKSVRVLLNRCLDDVNDEVRDRATLYLSTMDNQDIAKKYVTDGKKGRNEISAFLLILVKILHTLCLCLSANLSNTSTIHMKMQKNSSLIQFQLSANRKKKKSDAVSLYKEERMRSI